MKFIKWKTLVITCIVCLLPVLMGIAVWNTLPDTMAIHFNINNEADNFAPKEFVVFGLPFIMAFFQIICCVANDVTVQKYGKNAKLETVSKWIVPGVAVVLQVITIGFGLGWNVDVRRIAALLVGIIFIVTGIYIPKLDYVKNMKVDTETAKKINRFTGFAMVIMGILMLVTIFLPPVFTVIWLILLIPYIVVNTVFAIKVSRRK